MTVTFRQMVISRFVIGIAFLGLGIWGLADARYATGGFWVAISTAWLLMAAFKWPVPRDVRSPEDN